MEVSKKTISSKEWLKLRYGQYRVYTHKTNCPTKGGIRNYWISELWTFR